MDHIKKAILKAKALQEDGIRKPLVRSVPTDGVSHRGATASGPDQNHFHSNLLELNPLHLERNRIGAHLPHSPFTIGFDVLRTRIFQIMRERSWKTLLITSPTPGCGKTVTAINLAISLARQPNCFVVLADCDFRKPHVSQYLGFNPERDLYDVLTGQAKLADVLRGIRIAGRGLGILATRSVVPRPSEVLSSNDMRNTVSAIKSISPETIAVFDVPPMLVADDVLAFMPEIDGVLLIVAAGETHYRDVQTCLQSIPEGKFMGAVYTKSIERSEQMSYGYY